MLSSFTRHLIAAHFFLVSGTTLAQTLFPENNATNVNPDVQLRITFEQQPQIGESGKIRIFDAKDNRLVDELDLSIPAGPTERATGDALTAPYLSKPYATDDLSTDRVVYLSKPYPYGELPKGRTNLNTKAGTPTAGALPPSGNYQLSIIGGFTDGFHFYPIITEGNTAIIQLHHNMLEYGKTYYAEIDSETLKVSGDKFNGLAGKNSWRFSTKSKALAPKEGAKELQVNLDGSGDFNTVQGALDFVPADNTSPVTINVAEGTYHEIVYFRQKHNITIQGEAPGEVKVVYANDEKFNPHPDNLKTNERAGTFPSRRATFMADNANDISLINLILETTVYGQAEGLLITGNRNILDRVDVIGSGDALQVNGPTYIVDSSITGTGDTILGRGPAFFERCTINSTKVFMWIRNTEKNHGNVFNNCKFNGTAEEPTTFARAPKNNISIYPYAEAVLINTVLTGIKPEGWGKAHLGENMHFWEYNSRNPDGSLIDTSKRVSWSRQLDSKKDAEIIKNYSDPTYVLGGWNPLKK